MKNQKSRICWKWKFKRKKAATRNNFSLESAITSWMWDMCSWLVFITDQLGREKAHWTQIPFNQQFQNIIELIWNSAMVGLKNSKFETRNSFKIHKSHDDSGNLDLNSINSEFDQLQSELQNCSLNDVWNLYEFGLLYQMSQTQTIAPAPIHNRKKIKKRITCLTCANADGSEKCLCSFFKNQWIRVISLEKLDLL